MSVSGQELYTTLQASGGARAYLEEAMRVLPSGLVIRWVRPTGQAVDFDFLGIARNPELRREFSNMAGSGNPGLVQLINQYVSRVNGGTTQSQKLSPQVMDAVRNGRHIFQYTDSRGQIRTVNLDPLDEQQIRPIVESIISSGAW